MKKTHIFTSYVIGLVLSVILTFIGYILVLMHTQSHHLEISHEVLIPVVLLLAFLQLIVQLFFFLHLWKKDSASKLNLGFFIATFSGILLIVIASIWIMSHLNYNMTPQQMDKYIDDQEGF